MDKLLWFAVVGLWVLLIGVSAFGSERNVKDTDGPYAVAVPISVASPIVQPVRNNVVPTVALRPTVVLSDSGHDAEVWGAFTLGGWLLLRAARRRRII